MQAKLNVPYAEKEKAKALGARFNSDGRYWYVPFGVDLNPFKRWLGKDLAKWCAKGGNK
jgi:hypothetical protein